MPAKKDIETGAGNSASRGPQTMLDHKPAAGTEFHRHGSQLDTMDTPIPLLRDRRTKKSPVASTQRRAGAGYWVNFSICRKPPVT